MQRAAVVTGGAGGIRRAIVRALAEAGHDVAILASDAAAAITVRGRRLGVYVMVSGQGIG